jgi:hypothetical protein
LDGLFIYALYSSALSNPLHRSALPLVNPYCQAIPVNPSSNSIVLL